MHLRFRDDERGAVLIIVALVMSVLLVLSAGGVMLFTLYGSHREMQKTADQSALAAAAGLPLLNPSQTLDSLGLDRNYQLFAGAGLDTALHSAHNVPDPRAVACAYAERNLNADSSRLVGKFGHGINAGGWCASHPSADGRVHVSLESFSSALSQCLSNLTVPINNAAAQIQGGLNNLLNTVLALGYTVGDLVNGLVPPLLRPVVNSALALLGLSVSDVNNLINTVPQAIAQLDKITQAVANLEALTPALMTPQVTVTVTERVSPPLMSLATGGEGVEMTVSATAERRLKNVVVLPGTPLLGVDLNTPLNATKPQIMDALDSANSTLNQVMTTLQPLGLINVAACQNLLGSGSQIYQDIDAIYNPPAGAPFTGADLVAGANQNVVRIAGETGTTVEAVSGEAFLVIAEGGPTPTTISNILGAGANQLGLSTALRNLPIPALDVALVAAHHLENGNIQNDQLIPDTLSARGLFTARLVQ